MRSIGHLFLIHLLLLAGCPASDTDDDSADPPADDDDTLADDDDVETFDAAAALERYLTGEFDSEAQSLEDPSYYHVELTMCAVEAPDFEGAVLYVEQAISGSSPYRQRMYLIEPGADPATEAVSHVFEFHAPFPMTGACGRDEPVEILAEDVEEKQGCATYLTWLGDRFEGGTHEQDCLTDYNGATYTTAEITIDAAQLTSWDRGFDEGGNQVWGATAGPYVFDRKSDLVEE